MPANGKPNGRFTLPALKPVVFSLTDGTDIPPPPDSPIKEVAPPAAPRSPAADAATATAPASGHVNGGYNHHDHTTTAAESPPQSPASPRKPSSIRRFLSRKSLNLNYMDSAGPNGRSNEDLLRAAVARPDSPSSFLSGRPSLPKKRSGSWFSRLGGGKRTSVVYENAAPQETGKKSMGPPPPKLPELNQLKAMIADGDGGSLGGGEMFKNIRGE